MTRIHVPIHLRWADLDAYNHVNNVEVVRLLEEARVRAFWLTEPGGGDADPGLALIDASAGAATLTMIARQEIEYLLPISYGRQPLDVQVWLGRLGGSSFEACYEVRSPAGAEPQALYARASTTIVLVDAASGRPRRISDEERAEWSALLEEPAALGRRG
ncbi:MULTISPECIES: acyl-CoA thioesterase [Clavibacter]|uniref:Acyl-CoA thioesterase n=2 Tax=Clavibacter TaxID=1573 RepID=A0A399NVD7_9MICO|nr:MULTISPECIES: thioesterase family protein [Clavibacter]KDP90347.1 4-hydroxybenzoyl-CoA thioesterase [Clavibacter cf. michiganensis LMG 26808]RII97737.1 acyl-CoA thioesterase [Clavibacter michiganensis]UKF26535.1 acyl-CoA thioesterase [Clavibacter sp. A6099]